jgi:NADH-quinone oxidoreductase subunit G
MVELTIDGNTVEVAEGSMIMHAAHKLGVYVPHFCYHKKLTIAANCRMCLVEVEKAPKALPACATPATNGMVVYTCSEQAIAAQKSVMEFLLINHPLDCPICDQGGECQLQDLAVGYGGSTSRYQEEKRVVFHKNIGPLVSAEEMSRCIHCTRCVRFGQEIAGVMELGMIGRGEHSEITSFVGHAVDSELSGNMIDICPVGALTSKPFRYQARTWELARRRTVSMHDSLGANLVVQVKNDEVLRVVPFENEDINECWISDRDRFAYEGLYTDRLTAPMIKGEDGIWHESNWGDALQAVAKGLLNVVETSGAAQIGALSTDYATLEEMTLLSRLMRGLGSGNIDARLRQTDNGLSEALTGAPWLGMPIADLETRDRVLLIGAFMRQDHPLMTQRLRQAVKHGTQVSSIDVMAQDMLLPLTARLTVRPSMQANAVAQVMVALADIKSVTVPVGLTGIKPSEAAIKIAQSLGSGEHVAILLGNGAVNASDASQLALYAQWLAEHCQGTLGFLTAGANTVGAYLAGAVPTGNGQTAHSMLSQPLSAYIVLHAEPKLDIAAGQLAVETLKAAQFTVALTPYFSAASEWASVILPIAPFTETSGTFVNAQGTAQSFKGTVPGLAQSRPGWKVLRVLGNLLNMPGFDEESSEAVRDTILASSFQDRLSNVIKGSFEGLAANQSAELNPSRSAEKGDIAHPNTEAVKQYASASHALERVADTPIYRSDAVVRRSAPLQQTHASKAPVAQANLVTLTALGLASGDAVKVKTLSGEWLTTIGVEQTLPDGVIRAAGGFESTAGLGHISNPLHLERA